MLRCSWPLTLLCTVVIGLLLLLTRCYAEASWVGLGWLVGYILQLFFGGREGFGAVVGSFFLGGFAFS